MMRPLCWLLIAATTLSPFTAALSVPGPTVRVTPTATPAHHAAAVSTPVAAPPATVVARPAATPVITYSVNWSATTPAYSQGQLLGGLACAPTATAMVTAHFAATQPPLGTRTPAEFVADLQPGEFIAGEGVPYPALARQLVELGYTHLSGNMGNTQAILAGDLASGPVIVTTDGNTIGQRGSHSLVVVALSNDGGYVLVNDPATGRQVQLPWSSFNALWAGGSYGIMLIRP